MMTPSEWQMLNTEDEIIRGNQEDKLSLNLTRLEVILDSSLTLHGQSIRNSNQAFHRHSEPSTSTILTNVTASYWSYCLLPCPHTGSSPCISPCLHSCFCLADLENRVASMGCVNGHPYPMTSTVCAKGSLAL